MAWKKKTVGFNGRTPISNWSLLSLHQPLNSTPCARLDFSSLNKKQLQNWNLYHTPLITTFWTTPNFQRKIRSEIRVTLASKPLNYKHIFLKKPRSWMVNLGGIYNTNKSYRTSSFAKMSHIWTTNCSDHTINTSVNAAVDISENPDRSFWKSRNLNYTFHCIRSLPARMLYWLIKNGTDYWQAVLAKHTQMRK